MSESVVWAEIDLGRVRRNVSALKGMIEPRTRFLAVVKADGYGHGAVEIAKAAVGGGADWLAVARVNEGHALRKAGIDAPILLLAEPPISAAADALAASLTLTVYTETFVDALLELPGAKSVHLKLDTGMHRYGAQPDSFREVFDKLELAKDVSLDGIWSHFAVAEDVLNPFTKHQFVKFMDTIESLGPRADGLIKHMANSAATMTFPESHLDMVRCGIAIYGIYPSKDLSERVSIEPALSFKSKVGFVKRLPAGESISYGQRYTTDRESSIASVPCGYADGVSRALTNLGEVLIRGRRYRVSGTVTMDHFLVDVGDDEVAPGDEVVIIGAQRGDEITAHEIALMLGTIPYEVVCAIGPRVPRVFKN